MSKFLKLSTLCFSSIIVTHIWAQNALPEFPSEKSAEKSGDKTTEKSKAKYKLFDCDTLKPAPADSQFQYTTKHHVCYLQNKQNELNTSVKNLGPRLTEVEAKYNKTNSASEKAIKDIENLSGEVQFLKNKESLAFESKDARKSGATISWIDSLNLLTAEAYNQLDLMESEMVQADSLYGQICSTQGWYNHCINHQVAWGLEVFGIAAQLPLIQTGSNNKGLEYTGLNLTAGLVAGLAATYQYFMPEGKRLKQLKNEWPLWDWQMQREEVKAFKRQNLPDSLRSWQKQNRTYFENVLNKAENNDNLKKQREQLLKYVVNINELAQKQNKLKIQSEAVLNAVNLKWSPKESLLWTGLEEQVKNTLK